MRETILKIKAGSHLYGTSTQESDTDFLGVIMPDKNDIFGLKSFEEIDKSVKSKDESGKNTKEAVDEKYYEYRKFIKLAIDNNPSVLEVLFVPSESIVLINDFGKRLLKSRHLFPWIQSKKKILAYAFSQRHKITIKRDNYLDILNGLDYIQSLNNDTIYLAEAVEKSTYAKSIFKIHYDEKQNTNFILIGDLNLQPYYHIKRVKEILQARIDKFGHRLELVNKYGFDTKFSGNLIRLLFNGRRILKTCELLFPFPEEERNILVEIKTGKWSLSKIIDYSNELQKEIESLEKETKLPSKPKTNEIESFMISELEKFLYKEGAK